MDEAQTKKLPIYPDIENAVKARHQVGGILESSVRTLVERGLNPGWIYLEERSHLKKQVTPLFY